MTTSKQESNRSGETNKRMRLFLQSCSLFGSCMLVLPTGVQWYWGNMCSYVFSYFYSHSFGMDESQAWWLASVFLASRVISQIISGWFMKHTKYISFITFIGICSFNAGVFTSSMAIKYSSVLLVFTLGLLSGIGSGTLYGIALYFTMQGSDNKFKGLLVSIIQGSYTVGAILAIHIMAGFSNPDDLSPTVKSGHYAYFTQVEIVDRVPNAFLILGGIFLTLQVIGALLVHSSNYFLVKLCSNKLTENETIKLSLSSKEEQKYQSANSSDKDQQELQHHTHKTCSSNDENISEGVSAKTMNVREMLTSKSFIILCFINCIAKYPFLIVTNDYKAFGQIIINDDFYFTNMGTAIVITSLTAKVSYGLMSKVIGYKAGLMTVFGLMSLSSAFMYVAPLNGKWLYFFDAILLALATGAQTTSLTITIVELFGTKDIAIKTGLMTVFGTIMVLTAPLLSSGILQIGGWFGVFLSGCLISLLNVILVCGL